MCSPVGPHPTNRPILRHRLGCLTAALADGTGFVPPPGNTSCCVPRTSCRHVAGPSGSTCTGWGGPWPPAFELSWLQPCPRRGEGSSCFSSRASGRHVHHPTTAVLWEPRRAHGRRSCWAGITILAGPLVPSSPPQTRAAGCRAGHAAA